MENKGLFYTVLAFILLFGVCLFAIPVRSQEVEMALKVSQGTTVREFHIDNLGQATMMACVFQAPLIASKFIAENLPGQWIILRITCGPPTLEN